MTDWIKHNGLSMPIEPHVKVLCRFRDGLDEEAKGYKPREANVWLGEVWRQSNWCHETPSDADIIEYKVVKG